MPDGTVTPLGAVIRGAAAGMVGTLAMDLVWYRRYRRGAGQQRFPAWEFSTSTSSYEQAGAPAQLGRRIAEGVFEVAVPDTTAGAMTNGVHWATGTGYGVVHGIVAGSMTRRRTRHGIVTGASAFLTSYLLLGLMGLYKPIWEYDLKTLYQDLSAHLCYGLTTASVFRILGRKRRPESR